MKIFVRNIIIVIICSILMLITLLFVVPKQYSNAYVSVLPNKYDYLCKSSSPKIVLVGGSSMAFGINSELLEKSTGMNVVNMGLHAGLGSEYGLELDNM